MSVIILIIYILVPKSRSLDTVTCFDTPQVGTRQHIGPPTVATDSPFVLVTAVYIAFEYHTTYR